MGERSLFHMVFMVGPLKRLWWWTPILALSLFAACASQSGRLARPIPQDHLAEISRPDIPLVVNDRVQDWLDFFQGPSRARFERYLTRSGRYIPMMRRILRQHGLPSNLVYLAMIESGFNPHAYSRARATGTWQFIYQTGLRYGLKADTWVDERRDPEKSTVAAAKYLKNLYDRYNNWYLAAAGYNAGEGKIDRAIRKYDTEDFWELAKGKYLRNETKEYVPKLIAAALIAKNPERYGFKKIPYEEPVAFDEVTLERPIDLRVAARSAGTTYEEIKALNPELLHWVTPLSGSEYRLKLPHAAANRFRQKVASLSPKERMGEKKLQVAEPRTVAELAREHDVPAVLLAAANGLSPSDTVEAGKKVVLPYAPPEGEELYEKVFERASRGGGGKAIAYKVRRGDNIARVSRRTGISVASLKRYNSHVDWSHLRKGQRIRLYASAAAGGGEKKVRHSRKGRGGRVTAVKRVSGVSKSGVVSHRIRSGETLSEIAQKYNVSTRELKRLNGISNPKRIRAGKRLKIPAVPQTASVGAASSM